MMREQSWRSNHVVFFRVNALMGVDLDLSLFLRKKKHSQKVTTTVVDRTTENRIPMLISSFTCNNTAWLSRCTGRLRCCSKKKKMTSLNFGTCCTTSLCRCWYPRTRREVHHYVRFTALWRVPRTTTRSSSLRCRSTKTPATVPRSRQFITSVDQGTDRHYASMYCIYI